MAPILRAAPSSAATLTAASECRAPEGLAVSGGIVEFRRPANSLRERYTHDVGCGILPLIFNSGSLAPVTALATELKGHIEE